ncbi:hypothetical protein [Paractinoplanes aksuensis]|uniref:hypothetical protein n=1 Tax=Paractinoplanes aksuensis TaxID=2939490 RepID=UPI003F690959
MTTAAVDRRKSSASATRLRPAVAKHSEADFIPVADDGGQALESHRLDRQWEAFEYFAENLAELFKLAALLVFGAPIPRASPASSGPVGCSPC